MGLNRFLGSSSVVICVDADASARNASRSSPKSSSVSSMQIISLQGDDLLSPVQFWSNRAIFFTAPMTARRGCHETPSPSRSLAVRGARPLGPIDLPADERAGFEHALVAECRFLVRFLGAQPVRRLGRAWIVLIDVILCAHVIATPIVFSEPRIRPPDPYRQAGSTAYASPVPVLLHRRR